MKKVSRDIIFTSEGRLNTKLKRIQKFRQYGASREFGAVSTYISNSTKEELCLEYVNSFLEQFSQLYPKRVTPFMIAENEYGTQKFVCNTIRPTQLPYSELYELSECASFLAGYIHYEPLDSPTMLPTVLLSPTLTLQEHTADCFDFATLLCSFLIGAGYDAYVVHGYAPRRITLLDQTRDIVPLTLSYSQNSIKKDEKTIAEEEAEQNNPYKPPDNSIRKSTYLESESERKRIEALDTFELWAPNLRDIVIDTSGVNDANRVHAWVYVRAGPREMKQSVFVEPTTGRTYQIESSPYTGIEALWNHKNFWVNLTPEKAISSVCECHSYIKLYYSIY
jgi:hypothetical protein